MDITATKNLIVFYMELWYNKKEEKDYLIICGKGKIIIIELFPQKENRFVKEFITSDGQEINMGWLVYNFKGKNYFISSSNMEEFWLLI